jgi:hypothetical protein
MFKFNDTRAEHELAEDRRAYKLATLKKPKKPGLGYYYKSDRALLEREAKNINAECSWIVNHKTMIYIELTAPRGFLWASTNESTLNYEIQKQNQEAMRGMIQEILSTMAEGFKSTGKIQHDEDCECESCELASDDPELQELDF